MKILSSFLLSIGIAQTFLWPCASALNETKDEYTARLQGMFEEDFSFWNDEAFAMWVGIADPDYGDIYFALGNSTGESPPTEPATLDQHFDIGSITKTFCGTMILLMVEEGLLELEDTVEMLVPEFTEMFPQYANNTVEDLLRMDTLVPDFLNDPNGILTDYSQDVSKRYSSEEVVAAAMTRFPAKAGTYSSTNYIVLDTIAETLTGRALPELYQEYVFEPLGLGNTMLPDRFSDGIRQQPAGTPYAGPSCLRELEEYGYPDAVLYSEIEDFSRGIVMASGAGAINSNIADLLAWAKSGTGDSLLSEELVNLRHQYDYDELTENAFAYGMAQYEFAPSFLDFYPENKDWYGHSGDAFGFGANAVKNDVLGAAVATAHNTCGFNEVHWMALRIVGDELRARQGIAEDDDILTDDTTDDSAPMDDDMPTETTPPTEQPTSSASLASGMSVVAFLFVLLGSMMM